MVAETVGPNVLDIGCSQGITSILCARRGLTVTGLDREERPLEYAKQLASREPEDVASRVQFEQTDVLVDPLPEGTFNTVLLGEILEHQADPESLIERAVAAAGDAGRIVITTPIGIHPHPDHRTYFDMRRFLQIVDGLCKMHLSIADLYIRCIVTPKAGDGGCIELSDSDLLAMSEDAMMQRQEEMAERITHFRGRCDTLMDRTKLLQARIDRFKAAPRPADPAEEC
jgi:2-polyprenyl-6-hydroxyphenyl methylase/3-demethylubiquinone-9 3-methyltransferase